ncbi:recombination regulator RecX [Alphaproteobacteria bacterium]|nr:recombination regulator RecX [Alphaproteobacteria bacterium]
MDNKDKLLKYAIYYLSKYSSSKKNLEFILKKKIRRLSDEKKIRFQLYNEIQIIIEKLEKLNLINDQVFVESKIQSLQYQAKSKNYIKQYLLQKGIDKQLIEDQISLFYENNKNLEKENALKFAKKRNLINNDQDYQKKLSKMARAGFSYDIAKEILK